MIRSFLVVALWLFTGALAAADPVREALNDGDVAALEAAVAALHDQARNAGEGSVLTDAYYANFKTTLPSVWDTVQAWNEAEPNSAYAKTALAWLTLERAWMMRGQRRLSDTSPQSKIAFRAMMDEVHALAKDAHEIAPDFPPPVETLAMTFLVGNRDLDVLDSLDTLLRQMPSKSALQTALLIANPNWGGPGLPFIEAVCEEYAGYIPDYSIRACRTEAVLRTLYGQPEAEDAMKVVPELDEPRLAYWRRELEFEPVYQKALPKDEVVRLIEEGLAAGEAPMRMRARIQQLGMRYGDPNLEMALTERQIEMELASIARDPFRTDHVMGVIELLLQKYHGIQGPPSRDPAALETARGLWPNLLPYGANRWETFMLGAELMGEARGPEYVALALPYYETAMALANQSPFAARSFLGRAAWAFERTERTAPEDLPKLVEDLGCPVAKAARQLKKACEMPPSRREAFACDPEDWVNRRAREVSSRPGLCSAFKRMTDLGWTAHDLDSLPPLTAGN